MREKERYTAADCSETGYAMPIGGKVIVIGESNLPDHHPGQLFYCTGGNGARPNPIGRSVFAVSLSTGEQCRWNRSDVAGILKPELLPDAAKLYLSQIRPGDARDVQNAEYSGYCFLEDGRYSAGVWLRDAREAVEFMEMQAPWQHRVLICDRDDFAVIEMINGTLRYPTREELNAFRQSGEPEQTGGMKVKYDPERIEQLKAEYPPGTRIELISMNDPYSPVPPGTTGTVQRVDGMGTLKMRWDNGRNLGIVPDAGDQFKVLSRPEQEPAGDPDMTMGGQSL